MLLSRSGAAGRSVMDGTPSRQNSTAVAQNRTGYSPCRVTGVTQSVENLLPRKLAMLCFERSDYLRPAADILLESAGRSRPDLAVCDHPPWITLWPTRIQR